MKTLAAILLLTISTLSQSFAQQHSRTPEQQQLTMFQGRWTIAGSESTYLEVCDWIHGDHIQCISTSIEKNGIDSSISYLTYSASEAQYLYYGLYGGGNSRTLRGKWDGAMFVFDGERVEIKRTVRWRVSIKPVTTDILDFREEKSVDAGPWVESASFQYIRASIDNDHLR